MKKVLLFIMLSVSLFARDLKPTEDNSLGTAGKYTFVCADDTNRVWAVSNDDINYKVVWFNQKTNSEEWLKCEDFDLYANVYTPSM